jgi:hypothetical protein
MLTIQASALAALLSSWSRKKSSARPVRNAINAATQTPSRPISTARGRSPRPSRQNETPSAAATAPPAPHQIDCPPASHPARKPAAGRVASSAARFPPSSSASDSSATRHPLRQA